MNLRSLETYSRGATMTAVLSPVVALAVFSVAAGNRADFFLFAAAGLYAASHIDEKMDDPEHPLWDAIDSFEQRDFSGWVDQVVDYDRAALTGAWRHVGHGVNIRLASLEVKAAYVVDAVKHMLGR